MWSPDRQLQHHLGIPRNLLEIQFFFFVFLGPHQQHMEVPSLGGLIGATAAGHSQSHSNPRSKPHLRPTPQLTTTHWARPGIEPKTSWILVGFVSHWAMTGTPEIQVLWPNYRPAESEPPGMGTWNIYFNKLSRWFWSMLKFHIYWYNPMKKTLSQIHLWVASH